jgi:hypothetical protein
VGRGDLVQRQRVGDGDGEGTGGGRRGEVGGGLLLDGGRKAVAAEQAKRDVGEEQRQNGKLGRSLRLA